jgi:hypothetical protein
VVVRTQLLQGMTVKFTITQQDNFTSRGAYAGYGSQQNKVHLLGEMSFSPA